MKKSILFVFLLSLATFNFADTIDVDNTQLTPLSSYSEAGDSDTGSDANTGSQNEGQDQENNEENEENNQDESNEEQNNESDE